MAVQGVVHATVMLLDNRVAAARGRPNGNWEHAFEIAGFYLLGVALSALLLCSPDRGPPCPSPATGSGSAGGGGSDPERGDGCSEAPVGMLGCEGGPGASDEDLRGPLPAAVNNQS
jgi:hypothetical protein